MIGPYMLRFCGVGLPPRPFAVSISSFAVICDIYI